MVSLIVAANGARQILGLNYGRYRQDRSTLPLLLKELKPVESAVDLVYFLRNIYCHNAGVGRVWAAPMAVDAWNQEAVNFLGSLCEELCLGTAYATFGNADPVGRDLVNTKVTLSGSWEALDFAPTTGASSMKVVRGNPPTSSFFNSSLPNRHSPTSHLCNIAQGVILAEFRVVTPFGTSRGLTDFLAQEDIKPIIERFWMLSLWL